MVRTIQEGEMLDETLIAQNRFHGNSRSIGKRNYEKRAVIAILKRENTEGVPV